MSRNPALLTSWRESTRAMKILLVVGMSGWLVAMASVLTLAAIEFTAGSHPKFAVAQYTHALSLKGETRFFTGTQAKVDSIAHFLLIGGAIVGAITSVFYNGIQKRRHDARRSASLDRLIAERHEHE